MGPESNRNIHSRDYTPYFNPASACHQRWYPFEPLTIDILRRINARELRLLAER